MKIRKKQTPIFSAIDMINLEATAMTKPKEPPAPEPEPAPARPHNVSAPPLPIPAPACLSPGVESGQPYPEEPAEPVIAVVEPMAPAPVIAPRALKDVEPDPAEIGGTASSSLEGAAAMVNSLGMAFALIAPGTFLMGSPETEAGRKADELQHEVTLSKGFYIQITPVTQAQWLALMSRNPSKFADAHNNAPVEGVSWNYCQEFIERLSAREGTRYRLPTEAEWEYACRAGSAAAFAAGEISRLFCEHDPVLDLLGWYCYNAEKKTRPVSLKNPNAWGLYDMHGNVGEWCQDWYGSYPGEAAADPAGPAAGTERVVRGGSWFASAKNCRAASRFKWPQHSSRNLQVIGFRVVRDL